jgi:DNA-binding CsgD family transcriptional regulator/DNA-binding XRE family transcriptional regulator
VPFPDWDEVMADIGDRIRAERQARGWSQAEMARRAGLVESTVKRLESRHSSHMATFVAACRALGVDMGYLLSAQWQMPVRRPVLSPTQVRVLAMVADGKPLSEAACQLLMTRGGVASALSSTYRRLGVAHVRRRERRQAAVRVAVEHGLISPSNRTS